MSIRRRDLLSFGLHTAGLGLSARAMPPLVTRWFHPQDPQEPQDPIQRAQVRREKQLRRAAERAGREGKPMLVLVVPSEGEAGVLARGEWFGAFLNHGGEQAMLEVALCVVACATRDEVGRIVGDVPVPAEAAMYLVDVARPEQPARVTPVAVELGDFHAPVPDDASEAEREASARRHVEPKLRQLVAGLVEARQRHGGELGRLAAMAEARLPSTARDAVNRWLDGGPLPADVFVVQAAALVRHRAGLLPDERRRAVLVQLVAAVEREVVEKPVAGARWVVSSECGMDPEDPTPADLEEQGMIDCGMALVSPMAERFLAFYLVQ